MLHHRIFRVLTAVLLASILTCQCFAIGLSADSAVLIEQRSGRVLYELDADEEHLIASITKVMTAVVAIEHGDLDCVYTVTAEDMAEGSSMYLQVGDELSLEELLYGLMLVSGNDAALAAAHCVSGSIEKFVALMNRTAEQLGMTHSHFANPNGLDAEGHYSSAEDMARLFAYAMENETFRRIVSTRSITIGERYLSNHNKLLQLCEGCVGGKTGFTKAAGRTLVSAAERDGMMLVCVTLRASDDWNDHINLYEYGFSNYKMVCLSKAGQKLASVVVRGGEKPSVLLATNGDLAYPVSDSEKIAMKIVFPASVTAPISPGQVLGTAYAYLDGVEVASVELVAMEAVNEAVSDESKGFFARLFH